MMMPKIKQIKDRQKNPETLIPVDLATPAPITGSTGHTAYHMQEISGQHRVWNSPLEISSDTGTRIHPSLY